jgi:site-specific DNA-methyltransferase (adenine-specific)
MDCIEGMSKYPDKYFDLAIVDPPYGIGESNKNRNGISKMLDKRNGKINYIKTNNEIKNWDKNPPNKEYFYELKRITKNQIIWGANHFIENITNANSPSWIVWDKCNGTTDFADCELAYTSFKSAVRQFKYMWNGMFQGKQSFKDGHIFEGNLLKHEKRIHKTQKPIILYKWLLTNYAKQGDKILDTHLGSGSSRIAAYDMGFDFVGYELDKDYFDAQEKRFNDFKQQLKLF